MDGEILKTVVILSLPVGILSYFLMRWSLASGRIKGEGGHKALRAEMKALKLSRRQKKAKSKNPLHNKWMRFGGGFYGAVGLYTFILIEAGEVIDFAQGYEGMGAMMASFGTSSFADLLVQFFVNSIKNFVAAIAWPGYWVQGLQGVEIPLAFVATYGAYLMGFKVARRSKPVADKTRGAG